MEKFSKGDKVVLVKSGDKGVVSEVYGGEKYAVWVDGEKYPWKVEGFQMKLANAACNSTNPVVAKAMNATTKTYDPNRRPSVLVGEINRKCPRLSAKVDAWFVWVEFRDKKGVKGRLPDAIMAEPGFPRDKLEVARVDADGVLFTVKGNPYVNATVAKNASDDFVTTDFIFKVERAENPLNDFIHYEIKGVDKGSLPRTRKDMLIDKVKRLLTDEKRKVASLESGLRALEQVK